MKGKWVIMGRLSDYVNSIGKKRYRSAYAAPKSMGSVEVIGTEVVEEMVDGLLSTDPTMDRLVRKLIAVATREARNRVSRDIGRNIDDDPRKAARAVKHVVYRRLFGSNISILNKRRASNERVTLQRQRKLDANPRQRGGNRRKREDGRNRLDAYYGSDRGFILRFLSSGTDNRETRFGNRGHIPQSGMFGHIAPWHMQQAVEEISQAVAEYITKQSNG